MSIQKRNIYRGNYMKKVLLSGKINSVLKSFFNSGGKICKKEKFLVAHHNKFGT